MSAKNLDYKYINDEVFATRLEKGSKGYIDYRILIVAAITRGNINAQQIKSSFELLIEFFENKTEKSCEAFEMCFYWNAAFDKVFMVDNNHFIYPLVFDIESVRLTALKNCVTDLLKNQLELIEKLKDKVWCDYVQYEYQLNFNYEFKHNSRDELEKHIKIQLSKKYQWPPSDLDSLNNLMREN